MDNTKRREFLKSTGLMGLGLFGAGSAFGMDLEKLPTEAAKGINRIQSFNMSGFAAPKLETVRVGIVGTSWWADSMHLPALDSHPHAEITAICGRNRVNAEKMARRLAKEEGIFSGASTGGALHVALEIAVNNPDAVIVSIACDRGDRYLSTGIFPV